MIKKIIGILVCMLMIFTILPASANIIVDRIHDSTIFGNTLYVGGNGPNNYSKIQNAIDNASDGDTVFVYHGFYSDFFPDNYACVRIAKKIALIGEDKRTTIIDGTASHFYGIYVSADNVTITGFTIQNAPTGIFIFPASGSDVLNVIVHDTIITENPTGLSIESVSNSEFYNNIISYSSYCGIDIQRLHGGIVHNNSISNNRWAIYMSSGKNIIEYNDIKNNEIGIFFYGREAEIRCNNFIKNKIDTKGHGGYYLRDFIDNPRVLFFQQRWEKNYWDMHIALLPKLIFAIVTIDITIWKFGSYTIGVFPSIQFDWHPAKKPYDIFW
jgi:parallel beta-helix repeat protein